MNPNKTLAVRKMVALSERAVYTPMSPGPIPPSSQGSLVITTEENVFTTRLEPTLPTARSLEQSPDYRPDWRWVVVEEYLHEINSQPDGKNDPGNHLKQILEREPDEIVREALQFHCGVLSEAQKGPYEYAFSCLQAKETEMAIKAMIIAGVPIDHIAEEVGTCATNIKTFVLLFFDVARYLKNRLWLCQVCKSHRWLQIAFDRGWLGIEEVILQRPQQGERNLDTIAGLLLGRVQASFLEKEASNIAPTDKELPMLLEISQSYGRGKFYLLDKQERPKGGTQSSYADSVARDRCLSELEDFAKLHNLDGCSVQELAEELRDDSEREWPDG
jgi:hypothetical protein